ncbi:MAG: glycosyltransferase [Betaproteobacteria bacterium TMED156]|nr:MAG: glycosyltransferase [Betaproteobacteria bacterium TMED156]
MTKKLSLVIPIFNEENAIASLVDKLNFALNEKYSNNFEVILVDDGSIDNTSEVLSEIEKSYYWLKTITLARNYGQSTALQAGFDFSKGEIIVTMDGDLQNEPADVPRLIDLLEENPDVDVISGWRKNRQDAAITRKIPSKIANSIISLVTGVKLHDYGCSLKVYRSKIIKNLRLYGEMHRFIPAIASEVGAKIIEIPVVHHPRKTGVSKYGIDRTVRVLLDLVWIKFSRKFMHRPIHAFGGIALIMLLIGLFIFAWLFFDKFLFGNDIGGRPLLILGLLLTLIGTQLLAVGLIGEILTRIYHEPLGRQQYLVKKTNFKIQD